MQNATITQPKPSVPAKLGDLDLQISTAKAYPRDLNNCLAEAKSMAMSSKDIAQQCNYSLKRGSTVIEGPSIRLAEIFLQAWGNLYSASRITRNDGQTVTAEAAVWDLEKNVKLTVEVKRSIRNREGKMYSLDMQTVTANAAASIALRNAAFRIIPKAYIDGIYKAAMRHAYEGDSLENLRTKALAYFKTFDYEADHILKFLGKSTISEITKDDLRILGGIKNKIEDRILNSSDAFPLNDAVSESNDKEDLDDLMREEK